MKKTLMCAICLLLTGALGVGAQDNSKAVYKDPHETIADRVHDLMSRMTVEEKVAQLESGWTMPSIGGFSFPSVFDKGSTDHLPSIRPAQRGTYLVRRVHADRLLIQVDTAGLICKDRCLVVIEANLQRDGSASEATSRR